MIKRHITRHLLNALGDTPVLLLNGARQTGKSTLVKTIAAHGHPARYITLDDATVLAAVKHDPAGFLAGLDGPVVYPGVRDMTPVEIEIDTPLVVPYNWFMERAGWEG